MNPSPFFEIEKRKNVAILWLNRPEKRNAMNWPFWRDLPDMVDQINADPQIHCFVIAAKGKSFSTGLDLEEFFQEFKPVVQGELADGREKLYQLVLTMQKGINAVYNSKKPSIALVQKHCIGGGLDLVSACDIRYASEDAVFSLRESKVAIVADMGSLQRLPHLIGNAHTRELALTGKDITADEAFQMGLVTKVTKDFDSLLQAGLKTAEEIAENPTIVIRGVKQVLNHGIGKTIEEGLDYVAVWNASMLDSKDFRAAIGGFMERKRPVYNPETRVD
ncbi:crotonase/enoyl-CoA hydratase family protein [Leptospira kanakyensis]|uniref:Crotonase/enoyl-CoA hydratase family protein n=1 Tax=Leptospira kanakyensis TaxID=2484968 RepID=A0A6N4Q4Q2_9LEPT|nr:crotonase/enoyl-CoA hydratase family protein [Leptospira kanakyensis]TGK53973.1 crotonase/enoyl-CoA hydratase family protein [Leptospira kanakyensis]TGK57768.1 crotonase/enoyl-CoA hydratase family protein [Leptospira kanakyensis]TGK73477.1 crotonase/enoyl-CoA hydratase family protein [Leptospira kanakyensis]